MKQKYICPTTMFTLFCVWILIRYVGTILFNLVFDNLAKMNVGQIWYDSKRRMLVWMKSNCRVTGYFAHAHAQAYRFPTSPLVNSSPLNKMAAILEDDIFSSVFLNETDRIPIQISLKFVPRSPIDNKAAFVQVMAWRRTGDKPLS